MTRRSDLAQQKQDRAAWYRGQIAAEVGALRPMGQLSEMATVVGYHGKRGVAVSTPVGTFVFAKARQPSAQQLANWDVDQRHSEQLGREAARLSVGFLVPDDGCVTGNRRVVENGRELEADDLLEPHEVVYLYKLANFFDAHPDEDCGVVQGNEIIPWSVARAELDADLGTEGAE